MNPVTRDGIIDRDNRMRWRLVTGSAALAAFFLWTGGPWGLLWLLAPLMFFITGPSRFDGYTRHARHNRRVMAGKA